jgi:hypothetical protein
MAQHSSVGARPFSSALTLQSKPEVDKNEFGLRQATLRFALANDQWPAKEPARATPCSSFLGDTLSMSFLNSISFMGAQTSRWTRDGQCPGIGILEVLCQGAKFDPTYESGAVTPYFPTVTTTLEDLTFSIYDTPIVGVTPGSPPPPGTTNQNVRLATTADVGASYINHYGSQGLAYLIGLGQYLLIDGSAQPGATGAALAGTVPQLSVGQTFLVKNQANAAANGIYVLEHQGTSALDPWRAHRSSVMDVASEFNSGVQVSVTDGITNKGTVWQCVPQPGTFIVGTSGVGFICIAGCTAATGGTPGTTAPTLVPLYNIHLLYHSIDLHFEYMATTRQQDLRYIKDEYSIDSTGLVDIGGGLFQVLQVERAEAQKPQSSSPTVWAAAPDDIWKAAVHYPGTSARLEQTPAGQYWHVLETASVKIEALLPSVASVL